MGIILPSVYRRSDVRRGGSANVPNVRTDGGRLEGAEVDKVDRVARAAGGRGSAWAAEGKGSRQGKEPHSPAERSAALFHRTRGVGKFFRARRQGGHETWDQ